MASVDERPDVWLKAFRVGAFKSFEKAELNLGEPFLPRGLSLLIGPNASGKSNLLEALRLISWLAKGQWLDRFDRAAESDELPIRGRAEDLALNGHGGFSLECEFGFSDVDWMNSLDMLRVRVGLVGSELRILHESFLDVISRSQDQTPLYEVVAPATPPSHELRVSHYSLPGPRLEGISRDQQLVLTQPATFGENHQIKEGCRQPPWLTASRADCLARIAFLDPVPGRMRGYVSRKADALREDGSNVSGVLSGICADPDGRESVRAFIRSLPEREIGDICFDDAPPDEVRVKLIESFGGRDQARDARVLSDGTLRVLAIAAAVLSVPEWSLLVIEEVDSGIHPSRAEALLGRVQQVARERHLNVLLTSHNPALLDALPDEALPNVTYCYRDPRTGFSKLLRLYDRPELLAQGPVGSLMFRGLIENALKDTRTEEERKAAAIAWIEARRGARR